MKAVSIFFLITILIAIVLISIVYLFIQSPSFPGYVERILNHYSPNPVEIGAVSYSAKQGLIVRDLIIGYDRKGHPFIIIPSMEVRVSFMGLLQRRIDRVRIQKPKIFIHGADVGMPGADRAVLPLPLTLSRAVLEDGEINVLFDEGKSFHVSEVGLDLRFADERYAEVNGSLYLDTLNIRVPLALTLDIDKVNLQQGGLSLIIEDLGSLPIHDLPLLGRKSVRGSARLNVDVLAGGESGLRVHGSFHDVAVSGEERSPPWLKNASGDIRAVVTASEDLQNLAFDVHGSASDSLWGMNSVHTLSARGLYKRRDRRFGVEKASFVSPLTGPVEIQGTLQGASSEKQEINVTLRADEVPLQDLKEVLSPFLPEGLRHLRGEGYARVKGTITGSPKKPHIAADIEGTYDRIDMQGAVSVFPSLYPIQGFTLSGEGSLRIACTVSHTTGGGFLIQGTTQVLVADAGFTSADVTRVGENINIDALTTFTYSARTDTLVLGVQGHVTGFELLWGRFFGNFKGRDLTLSLEGEYERMRDIFSISRAEVVMAGTGTVGLTGTIRDLTGHTSFAVSLDIDELSNKNFYDLFIRETFGEKFPFLAGIETGGRVSFHAQAEGGAGGFRIRGKAGITDMHIMHREAGLSLQGISLSLPVNVSYPDSSLSGDAPGFGFLEIRELSKNSLSVTGIRAAPSLWGNALIFREAVVIPLFRGKIHFKDIVYSDLLNPERTLALSMSLEGIELEEVSKALALPRLSGTVAGRIPDARLTAGSLRTEGTIIMSVFNGEIAVDDLSAHAIFGPVPSVEASVEIRDINLERLTETLEFGHISGVVRGYIRELVVVNGQAERFDVSLESVQSEGIDQWISVEALEKISILGSGTPSAVLSRGIYRFFRKYRYSRMGFQGTLRNDTLLLVGIETEGGRGYLVKGSPLPPRVDVINYTQKISYRELIKRLERIRHIDKRENTEIEKHSPLSDGGNPEPVQRLVTAEPDYPEEASF